MSDHQCYHRFVKIGCLYIKNKRDSLVLFIFVLSKQKFTKRTAEASSGFELGSSQLNASTLTTNPQPHGPFSVKF